MNAPLASVRSAAARLVGRDRRKQFSVHARLSAIESRLDDIDGRLNHWIQLLESLNHGISDIQHKLGDASADVEMAAAMLMATERRLGRDDPAT